jgi:hypothetical protein
VESRCVMHCVGHGLPAVEPRAVDTVKSSTTKHTIIAWALIRIICTSSWGPHSFCARSCIFAACVTVRACDSTDDVHTSPLTYKSFTTWSPAEMYFKCLKGESWGNLLTQQ